jgi:hypothetical protein
MSATPSGVWRRENGNVMLPVNAHRASLRERLYVIGLGWRACHNVRLTLFMIRQYLRPSAQVCDYEEWTTS